MKTHWSNDSNKNAEMPISYNFDKFSKVKIRIINPQAPVAHKIADEVVFRQLQGEGVEFF